MKFKFGGFLKQIFSRPERQPVAEPTAQDTVESAPAGATSPEVRVMSEARPKSPTVVSGVTIPFSCVLPVFPLELRAKIRQSETGSLTLTIAFEKVKFTA